MCQSGGEARWSEALKLKLMTRNETLGRDFRKWKRGCIAQTFSKGI